MKLGFHVSTSKGYPNAINESLNQGGTTFQFFASNPRGNSRRALENEEINEFNSLRKEKNFDTLVCHAPYVINLASNKENVVDNAKDIISKDLYRLSKLNVDRYVLHPGNHVGQGSKKGMDLIVKSLNDVLNDELEVYLCLETMSGMGTEIGSKFEELGYLIKNIDYKNVAVCLDTCHIYSAGYDIKNNYEGVIDEFDRTIGLDKLKVIHFNDTLKELGSKKDRHEKIGEGVLGIETFKKFINDERLKDIPIILETPNDLDGYKKEIEMIRNLQNE